MTDITTTSTLPPPNEPAMSEQAPSNEDEDPELLYELKEQLLLLTTLVATVTYVTGLNLPGGAWQTQQGDGHLAGDPILRDIHYRRYLAFYYCNGTALASSVVVCLILVMLQKKRPVWTLVLRVVMVLDLLGLMGSYAAGTCHDTFATIWAVALACPVLAYITFAFVTSHCRSGDASTTTRATATGHEEKEKIEVLMLLATFAVTISYAAGLNPPGGFWTSTVQKDGRLLHLAGDPIMEDGALRRYRAFFVCNTTAFVASLFIIPLLLDKKLSSKISAQFLAVYGFIAVALLGLMGAYAAGSCRKTDSTVKVIFLAAAVPACVGLQLALSYALHLKPIKVMRDSFSEWLHHVRGTSTAGGNALEDPDLKNTRYFVMVLASFAVSITYQAGLDPPGGLWQDKLNGHKIGQPVLRTTHPTRYQVFFYSNSAAFVTSLVVVMMVQSKFLLKRRTLVAAMVLDLLGLVIAYSAGCTRDTNTSIYVVAMACLVLSYAVVHIALGGEKENMVTGPVHDLDHAMVAPAPATPAPALTVGGGGQSQPRRPPRTKEQLDDKRQVLLLIAILAAALTYQAGLTPPGGFWQADDDKLGHRAGYPVLLDNYPRRYKAFFYCNAASFMASVALILLLVNRKLYRPGIRCYALHVCMAVGMLALMGAYASGSSRHLKTSIYVLTLVAVVSASIPLQVAIFWYFRNYVHNRQVRIRRLRARGQEGPDKEKDEELEYLMLLVVLAASVTYQSGLRPAGGMWQEDNANYFAGNPILRDINKRRYNIFLYSNSTSFMASIIAIVMLLPLTLSDDIKLLQRCLPFHKTDLKWSLWPVHTAILLDMLGLLVAYAAGSTRKWESSRNVILLVLPVLAYIALYAMAAAIYIYIRRGSSRSPSRQAGQQATSVESSS